MIEASGPVWWCINGEFDEEELFESNWRNVEQSGYSIAAGIDAGGPTVIRIRASALRSVFGGCRKKTAIQNGGLGILNAIGSITHNDLACLLPALHSTENLWLVEGTT